MTTTTGMDPVINSAAAVANSCLLFAEIHGRQSDSFLLYRRVTEEKWLSSCIEILTQMFRQSETSNYFYLTPQLTNVTL